MIEAALKSLLMARGPLFEAGNSMQAVLELNLVLEKACVRCWWYHDRYHDWFGLDQVALAKESVTCL